MVWFFIYHIHKIYSSLSIDTLISISESCPFSIIYSPVVAKLTSGNFVFLVHERKISNIFLSSYVSFYCVPVISSVR